MLETIVAEEPRNVDAWFILAGLQHSRRQFDAAAHGYDQVIALNPRHAEAHYFLGNLKGEQGDHESAMCRYRAALELRPGYVDAARNLGALLHDSGRAADAIDCYRRLLRHSAGSADIHMNLGNALADIGAFDEAISAYREALRLDPGRAELHIAVGDLLDETGNPDAAIAEYQLALAAAPDSTRARRALGAAFSDHGRPEEAIAITRGDTPDLRVRAATVLPVILRDAEEIARWRERYSTELARLSAAGIRLENPLVEVGSTYFFLSYHGLCNRDLNRELADFYARACPSLLWTAPHCGGVRKPGRTRIGFISRFLYHHSIGKTSRGLIAELPRNEFEVLTLFVAPVHEDDMARSIRSSSDRAIVLQPDLEAARRQIAALELDVLFYQDIGMDAFTYFLAFARLAPVQCVSFGHPDTTGIANVDYWISNDLFEPADAIRHYSEQLFQLRDLGTLAYYYRPRTTMPAKSRGDFGLPHEANLYLCPQALFKFHPDFDAVLAGILRADPLGRVVILEGSARNWGALLRRRFQKAFPDVAERALFLRRQSMSDFTQLVAACDVMLDTPHFNGMNTSLEALALGTPTVTLAGALQRGRHTAGMYRKMQWTELVARDAADYIRIAVALGTQPDRRQHARREILQRSDVLFEDPRVVGEFGRFFREATSLRR